MAYSLYLFDYDGTLCDTRQAIAYSFRRTFAHYRVAPPAPAVLAAANARGLILADMFRHFNPALTAAEVAEWVLTYRAIYVTEAEPLVTPFPGARALFEQLTGRGAQLAVLSNKGVAVLEASLEQLGLRPYVSLVVGDGSRPDKPLAKKPDPMMFHELVRPRFPQLPPARMLMIGDTPADLEFARNCGIDSCWVSFGFGDAAECQAWQPTHVVASLAEIGLLPTE